MSDHAEAGEKTEQPTPRKLEEASKKGQFARSSEIQTVFVLIASLLAFFFAGAEIWNQLTATLTFCLAHLHDLPLSLNMIHGYALQGAQVLAKCVGPILAATVVGGLLAGGMQSRFHTASEALSTNWERINPVQGFKRILSPKTMVPAALAAVKLAIILFLSYSVIRSVVEDPIFYTTIDVARIAEFLSQSSFRILLRIVAALVLIAGLDYAYQCWRTHRDLMMTKEEVKDEMKSSEGNPLVKSQQRRRRQAVSQRRMLMEVPHADVVVTNPTHLAIALRYDRQKMKAPRIVAKGSRLNALRIREIAGQHQVPIVENKPLARLLFKHGKPGGEIPAQLYAAVAEVLAWVYRVNAYRYYRQKA